MFLFKYLFFTTLLIEYARAATIAKETDIQIINATDIGPEFVQIESATPNEKVFKRNGPVEDAAYWKNVGIKTLKKKISNSRKANSSEYQKKAKNIIIFIGDGMGLTTITAGRIYKGQFLKNSSGEEEELIFDTFSNTGLAKTYNVDKQVPDSAGTATAMFSGIKTHYGAIGVDITRSKTNATQGQLSNIMDWAQAVGKRTGIVTTTRITHATPASTYAKIYHRDWECDTKVPAESFNTHVDIARQLIESSPGKNLNVIMGGGLSPMGAFNVNEQRSQIFAGSTEDVCKRGDARNLTKEWMSLSSPVDRREFVQNIDELKKLDLKNINRVMGLFRNNHITYSVARQPGEPSLKEMTEAAIDVLERENSNGFVLMVEGGRIDQAHHQNYAKAALREVIEFDMAIEAAYNKTKSDETLIIVTADHSHSVTLNGYPKRGGDILGFANKETNDYVYETISYANGPGYWDHIDNQTVTNGTKNFWLDMKTFSNEQRSKPNYRAIATIPLEDETHGGEDVIVFANGPGSNLVRGVFEQNYIAYVMSYAACMGPAAKIDYTCQMEENGAAQMQLFALMPLIGLIIIKIFC